MSVIGRTVRIIDLCNLWMARIAGALVIGSMLLVAYNVVARYVFNSPLLWGDQVGGHVVLYITFLAVAWVLKNEQHVKMDVVLNMLSPKRQHMLTAMTSLAGMALCLLLAYVSWNQAWKALVQGLTFYQEAVPLPKFPVLVIMPIGFFLLALQFGVRAANSRSLFLGYSKQTTRRSIAKGGHNSPVPD